MATQVFEDRNIHYAYESIHEFFDNFDLRNALKRIDSIIKAATSEKIWKMHDPSILIYYIEKLQELCEAALVINYHEYSTRAGCILKETETGHSAALRPQDFGGRDNFIAVWNCFPRNLTLKQYHNPYKAIKKFATYMAERQWTNALKELVEYALRRHTIYDIDPLYDILGLRLQLLRLIEACHLLEVRSNIKKTEQEANQKNNLNE